MSEEIPEGWVQTELSRVADLVTGFTPPTKDSRFYKGGTIPFVKPGDLGSTLPIVNTESCVTREGALRGRLLPAGSSLVCCIGSIGKVGFLGGDAICNQQINAAIPTPTVEPRYLFYWLATLTPWLDEHASETTIRIINKARFSEAPVRLAPLSEQHRIVEKVEAVLDQVNRAKARLDRVPLILKRFRQAVLMAACSGKLTEEWRERVALKNVSPPDPLVGEDEQENTDSFLGTLPATWAWAAIDDACSDVIDYRGRTPPVSEQGTLPHVRTTNIRNGRIDWNTKSRVTEAIYQQYMTRGIPNKGDVIFTMEAPLGDAAVVPDERKFSLAQRLLLLRGRAGLLQGPFLALALQSPPVQRAIELRATGTTVLGIAYKRLKHVRLPLPPLEEQEEIGKRVEHLAALAAMIEQRVHAASVRAAKLPESILNQAFSGELVSTEAELARQESRGYEPAVELLKRARQDSPSPAMPRRARTPSKVFRTQKRERHRA